MRNSTLLGLSVLAASAGAAAADPLPVDISKVEFGPVRFQLIQHEKVAGEMFYELERRGDEIVIHDGTTLLPDVRESLTAVIDADTLAPKSIVLDGDFSRTILDADLQFNGEKVSGDYVLKRPADTAKTKTPFDMDMLPDAVLRASFFGLSTGLPLEEGVSYTFPWFSSLARNFAQATFTVTGAKTIEVPAGEFETFIGELKAQPENVIYITTETPHRVVRIDVIGQDMRFERLPAPAP